MEVEHDAFAAHAEVLVGGLADEFLILLIGLVLLLVEETVHFPAAGSNVDGDGESVRVRQVGGVHQEEHAFAAEAHLVDPFLQKAHLAAGGCLYVVLAAVAGLFFTDALDGEGIAVRIAHENHYRVAGFHVDAGRVVQVAVAFGHQLLGPFFHVAVGLVGLDAEFLFPWVVGVVAQHGCQRSEVGGQGVDLLVGGVFLHLGTGEVSKDGEQLLVQHLFVVFPVEFHFVAADEASQTRLDAELHFGYLGECVLEVYPAGRILHLEVVAALQLVFGFAFCGRIDIHLAEVPVSATGVVDEVVEVGFLVEEVFQRDGESCLLVPDGVVGLSVCSELPVETVFDVLAWLAFAGLSAGGYYQEVSFHNYVFYTGLLGSGWNYWRFFILATGGHSYQHTQAGRQT